MLAGFQFVALRLSVVSMVVMLRMYSAMFCDEPR